MLWYKTFNIFTENYTFYIRIFNTDKEYLVQLHKKYLRILPQKFRVEYTPEKITKLIYFNRYLLHLW